MSTLISTDLFFLRVPLTRVELIWLCSEFSRDYGGPLVSHVGIRQVKGRRSLPIKYKKRMRNLKDVKGGVGVRTKYDETLLTSVVSFCR